MRRVVRRGIACGAPRVVEAATGSRAPLALDCLHPSLHAIGPALPFRVAQSGRDSLRCDELRGIDAEPRHQPRERHEADVHPSGLDALVVLLRHATARGRLGLGPPASRPEASNAVSQAGLEIQVLGSLVQISAINSSSPGHGRTVAIHTAIAGIASDATLAPLRRAA